MIAYKVCREIGGKLLSANSHPGESQSQMSHWPALFREYKIGKTTVCDPALYDFGYGLAVFSTYRSASTFRYGFSGCVAILLVNIEDPLKDLQSRFGNVTNVLLYLRSPISSTTAVGYVERGKWPKDTLLVKKVTPLFRLQ